MKSLDCLRAETRIDARAVGLSTSDALWLEEHLAGCEACSEQAALFAQLRRAAADVNTTLTPIARERAIASALAAAQREPVLRLHVRSWRPLGMAVAAAVLLGAGLHALVGAPQRDQLAAIPQRAAAAGAARSDRVLAGSVQLQGQTGNAGAAIENDATLQSASGATLELAQATVELRPGTRAHWNKRERTLRVEAGRIVADVDPSAHARFTVQTERFVVVVLGTRFEVSLDGVSVTRGRVQVLAPDGRALAQLGAGERFVAPSANTAAPVGDESTRVPTSTSASNAGPAVSGTAPALRGGASLAPAHVHGDGAALLAEARAQLASKHVARAKKLIDAALAFELDTTAHAEALSLRADCALVEGDKTAAVRAYLGVARAFAQLPAGENALFAAARIEAERDDRAAATRWLTRYLERYPNGRFVQEARSRLRELSSPAAAP